MIWLLLVLPAVVSLVAGYLLLRRPELLVRWSSIANRIVLIDHVALLHRKSVGGVLLVLGMVLLLVAKGVAR
ncbi:MAG: hypothetical protein ONB23_00130 [candidate division KSB1 bacterium]|nr:hypothetical protein [candidate division KSB1 bacterium]